MSTNYEKETRSGYGATKARSYKNQQTKDICWARITTWRERVNVESALAWCNLKKIDKVLDIPCGSGIMADILLRFPARIVASDISEEMMNLAREDYRGLNFKGFIKADITEAPFKNESFHCVVIIGLMHRLPLDIRLKALRGAVSLCSRFLIVSYSIDSPAQRVKQWFLRKLSQSHKSAPVPTRMKDIVREVNSNGLTVKKIYRVVPILSAERILILEKNLT